MALKIWTKLRSGDKRDKQKQALYEAQKACEVEIDHRHFGIRIYDGGPISNGFYMAMEFFPGVTLNSWLTSEVQSLAVRWALANQLVEILHRIASLGILHGDMHTKNILVRERTITWTPTGAPHFYDVQACPDFRIIDYGTSFFNEETSRERHWRLVKETFDEILFPLTHEALGVPYITPENETPDVLNAWKAYISHYLYYASGIIERLMKLESGQKKSIREYNFSKNLSDDEIFKFKDLIKKCSKGKDYTKILGSMDEWVFVHSPFAELKSESGFDE